MENILYAVIACLVGIVGWALSREFKRFDDMQDAVKQQQQDLRSIALMRENFAEMERFFVGGERATLWRKLDDIERRVKNIESEFGS